MSYYDKEVKEILEQHLTSRDGISEAEADIRLKKYGLNELQTKSEINKLAIFMSQLKSFLIYMLLFAVVFAAVIGEIVEAFIILAVVILNALVGYFQEVNAQKSLEELKKISIIEATVIREGKRVKLDSKRLVIGDIIVLYPGDKVPADCRIIESSRLRVDESSLTGESSPALKKADIITETVQVSDQGNMVFFSTIVTEGSALAVVVRTGMDTELGKIANMMKSTTKELTPLQRRLEEFGRKLGFAIIGICILVFAMSFFKDILINGFSIEHLLAFILIAISLAVAAVPSGLPAVVTISLSIGVKKLLTKNALVKNISSVETLGSCNIICTDKTGTITKNEMTVVKAFTLDDEARFTGTGYSIDGKASVKLNPMLYTIGLECNNASHYVENGEVRIIGSPTEVSLIVSAKKEGMALKGKRIDELQFTSAKKMMSVLVELDAGLTVYSKGAPDRLLERCTHAMVKGRKIALTKDIKARILAKNEEYASYALRVLAFGYKNIKTTKDFNEKNLIFVGLQGIIDPPRADVIESIKITKDAGIRVIMITGDHSTTATAIAKQIGIEGSIIEGSELEDMGEKDLICRLEKDANIFARVTPEHKLRIVTALQKMGFVVAMTGDGVNDAPALKKADIGMAVGSGTEVAKEAADFILLDNSFTNIVNAIKEGRGIYENIQKSIMLLLSGNIGEVFIIFFGILFGLNLPLTAVLLLWINLITDGPPALAYSVDPYSKDIMKQKPKNKSESILPFNKALMLFSLGLIGTVIGLFIFYRNGGLSNIGEELKVAQTIMFNFIVIYEFVLAFIIRRFYGVRFFSNGWLWLTVFGTIIIQYILMYTPVRHAFNLMPLDGGHLVILAAAGGLFAVVSMIYFKIVHIWILKDRF